MRKVIVALVAILLLLPIIVALRPKPITLERAQQVFEANGMFVEDAHAVNPPGIQSVEQFSMFVDSARVDIYRYDDEGKVAKNFEYQKTDVGTAMVENMNLAQQLGAAPPRRMKSDAARKRMYLIVVADNNDALRGTIIKAFKSM